MQWIALHWPPEAGVAPEALGWWALRFTPRVVWLDEALLLEVSACERLWGGRQALLRDIARSQPTACAVQQALGATSLVALARLRLLLRGQRPPAELPGGLPLDTLSAAREHLDVLAHLGCRTWGQAAALPRGGLARRFGPALGEALDTAWGRRPEQHRWLTLPEVFEQKLELPALAESAPELLWSAQRLLGALQLWLRGRQQGALAIALRWTLDLRRFNGVELPPHQQVVVRTAEPTQDMGHLRRLLAERLALTQLQAPASWLTLRCAETAPWGGQSLGFLPEDNRPGDRLHELVERLSARLGPAQVLRPVMRADHRPECRQAWLPAVQVPAQIPAQVPAAPGPGRPAARGSRAPALPADALSPAWLLREPLALALHEGRPCFHGVLRRLVGPQRLEAGWWTPRGAGAQDGTAAVEAGADAHEPPSPAGHPAVRDYFIAESPGAGLVWIFRERPADLLAEQAPRWFLQGLYA